MTKLAHALHYANLGIPVLPLHYVNQKGICSCGGSGVNTKCKPGKHPYAALVPHGVKDASNDLATIQQWFHGTPYNIGIATGDVSGFFVLDRDDRDGGKDTLAAWEQRFGKLPETLIQRTGNGMHYLFKMPTGIDIRNIQKKTDAPGLDVRGNGGYICAAPTIHHSGRQYEWIGCELMDASKIAEAPSWLIEWINPSAPKSNTDLTDGTFTIPGRIGDGEGRESFLLRYAGHLRSKGNDPATIDRILLDYNKLHVVPPLDDATVLDKARRYKADSEQLGESNEQVWNNPQEVKASLPPVPDFDYALLPPVFRDWVKDIAERMQCPPDFLGVGAMVAVGSVIGNRIGIQPKQLDAGWVEVPNLWGAVIGRPGVMKTPALSQVLAPLKELEQQAQVAHASVMAQYQVDKMLHEANLGRIKDQVKKGATIQPGQLPLPPDEPQPKRYLLNDATYQKIGEVLKANPHGLMVFQDELSGLLMRLDSDGQESARAFYLQAWDGKQSYTFDRIGRGTIGIPNLCFSMLGGIQPGRIREYLRAAVSGGKGDDGLAQRLQLLVYPETTAEWTHVDRLPDMHAMDNAYKAFRRLAALDPSAIGASDNFSGIPVLKFSEQAQGTFIQWWGKLESGLRTGQRHPALESHFSKFRKLIPALALIDHLVEGFPGPVQLASLHRAIKWHGYLKKHAERAYAVVTAGHMESARVLYDRIARGSLKDGFSARDIYRNGWSMLTTPREATEAAETLVDLGWLRAYSDKIPGTDGRPTVRYLVNPLLKKAA